MAVLSSGSALLFRATGEVPSDEQREADQEAHAAELATHTGRAIDWKITVAPQWATMASRMDAR